MQGERGQSGYSGKKGITGPPGKQGICVLTLKQKHFLGMDGSSGNPGSIGLLGKTGPLGLIGPPGDITIAGIGIKGPKGQSGSVGVKVIHMKVKAELIKKKRVIPNFPQIFLVTIPEINFGGVVPHPL